MTEQPVDPQELIDLWLEMLESGDYKQCFGKLRDGDSFCATGLLAEAFRLLGGDMEWEEGVAVIHEGDLFARSSVVIPWPCCYPLEMENDSRFAWIECEALSLNEERVDFHDIANQIRARLAA